PLSFAFSKTMMTPSKAEIGHARHRQTVLTALKSELAALEKENGMHPVRGSTGAFALTGQIQSDTLEDQELHIKNEYSDGSWVEIRGGHQGDDWDALVMVTS